MQKICKNSRSSELLNDTDELLGKWNQPILDNYNESNGKTRKVRLNEGTSFLFFFSEKRAKCYYNLKELLIKRRTNCPLENLSKKNGEPTKIDDLTIISNTNPFAPRNRVLISAKHSPKLRAKHLKTVLKLAKTTNDTFICSMKGSGAGVPQHFHFQSFFVKLPLIGAKTRRKILQTKEISIEVPNFPTYALKISGDCLAEKSLVLFSFFESFKLPYNLVIFDKNIFFIPRKRERPKEFSEWRFGACELSGYLVFREYELFKKINAKKIAAFLKETTIGTNDQQIAEKKARRTFK